MTELNWITSNAKTIRLSRDGSRPFSFDGLHLFHFEGAVGENSGLGTLFIDLYLSTNMRTVLSFTFLPQGYPQIPNLREVVNADIQSTTAEISKYHHRLAASLRSYGLIDREKSEQIASKQAAENLTRFLLQ